VCIIGLVGNTLVIYVVIRFSKMQTVTNMYIVNLAIADECFLIGIPFLIVTMSMDFWPFGNIMCKVYMTTTSVNQFTSSIFLMIMSADRYIAICHPISSSKVRTAYVSKIVSVTAWTFSIILMIPVIMYASTMDKGNVKSCNIIWPENELFSGQTAFTLYSFVLGFAIPLMLIFVFYILVIRKLQTVRIRIAATHDKPCSNIARKSFSAPFPLHVSARAHPRSPRLDRPRFLQYNSFGPTVNRVPERNDPSRVFACTFALYCTKGLKLEMLRDVRVRMSGKRAFGIFVRD
jgi:hypothetical protein